MNVATMLCLTWKQWIKVILGLVVVEIVVILLSEMRLHVDSGNDLPVEQLNGYSDEETAESFLRLYETYCGERLYPKMSNVPAKFLSDYSNDTLCSCVPDTIGT